MSERSITDIGSSPTYAEPWKNQKNAVWGVIYLAGDAARTPKPLKYIYVFRPKTFPNRPDGRNR